MKMLELEKSHEKNDAPRSKSRGLGHQRSNTRLTCGGLFLLTLSTRLPSLTKAQAQAKCDLNSDSCPYQFDGECDADVFCSADQDCFDCDECSAFNYDCGQCTSAGCFWCSADALCTGTPLGPAVWNLHPLRRPGCPTEAEWVQTCDVHSPPNVWTDPLYDAMKWSYQLINVEEVWKQNITGAGVHVRINDDGFDSTHPELSPNFDLAHSCEIYLPVDNSVDMHGTACATIIGGAKNNGQCAAGIAPDVTLSACNNFASPEFQGLESTTALFMVHIDVVDIISNSWGPLPCTSTIPKEERQARACPFSTEHPDSPCQACGGANYDPGSDPACEAAITKYCSTQYELDPVACGEYLDLYVNCDFHTMDPVTEEGLPKVIAQGRSGKGPIITFAGGNDYTLGVDANYDGMVNSRYTIGVGAVGKDGLHASYSTTGAAIFIAGPGGDKESLSNNIVAKPGGGCHDITVGTSFATPVVSAVAALMLQANPELGWRDVQAIMQQTAAIVDFTDSTWVTNGAGVRHSYKYGFGLIDAAAAVAKAKAWVNWGAEKQILVESGVIDVTIPDYNNVPNEALSSLTISQEAVQSATGVSDIQMESVVVFLNLQHASRGDLKITLTSPQGTASILAPGKRPENTLLKDDQRWKLMTLRNWGENPIGTWKLEIVDEQAGVLSECIDATWMTESDGVVYTCADLSVATDCSDPTQVSPSLQVAEFDGITIFDACCACNGGTDAATIKNWLVSWRLIAYGHEARTTDPPRPVPITTATMLPTAASATSQTPSPATPTTTTAPGATVSPGISLLPAVDTAACPYLDDNCSFPIQFDRECDAATLNCSDCFDCDKCQAFTFDCASCVQNGCVWCKGDATCLSVALDTRYWDLYAGQKVSSCPTMNDWVNSCENNPANVFADPLYDSMAWSYQLINVESVWREGVTGAGVHVRVNDDGVDGSHAEFVSKFDVANSCASYLPASNADDHGTASASIIAASSNNECAVGIAPGATVSACKFSLDNEAEEVQMFLQKMEAVDVSSNSYGPDTCTNTLANNRNLQQVACPFSKENLVSPCAVCGDNFADVALLSDECLTAVSMYCSRYYEDDETACIEYMDFFVQCQEHFLPTALHDAWAKTITEGRNGKGVIYLVSAGNLYNLRENSNANGMLNSRFTMAVGAVGKDGLHASYSTAGSSVFIAAPGGDLESISNNIVAKPGGGCHDIGAGTSFSAPVVAGVVALMLEVAPELTWRDVQGVLASTARVVDAADASWTSNSAGVAFSNKYGFGIVDAAAAVAAARTWQNWGKEIEILGESGTLEVEIPDLMQVASTMSVSDPRNLIVESVIVYLDLPHQSRGDLKISLTSPKGTVSTLAESRRPLNQQFTGDERWKFLTYAAWGESPVGNWTLIVADEAQGILNSCVDFTWGYEQQDGSVVTCATFAAAKVSNCVTELEAELLAGTFEGRTPLQACCACGGGQDVSGVKNVLKSWRLQIYAHDADVTPAPVVASATPRPAAGSNSSVAPQIPGNSNSTPVSSISKPPLGPVSNKTLSGPAPLDTAVVFTVSPGASTPWITNGSPSSATHPRAFSSMTEKISHLMRLGAITLLLLDLTL